MLRDNETLFKYPETVDIRSYKPQVHGDPTQIAKAAALIKKAKKSDALCWWWCCACQCKRGTAES